MVSESYVYLTLKNHLRDRGWDAVAGDPPRGTDLPPLEVKEPNVVHSRRKNANSVIFDLVFGHGDDLLLIECKDGGSKIDADVRKLRAVRESEAWRVSLVTALRSGSFRKRFTGRLDGVRSGSRLTPCIAHPDDFRSDLDEFVQFRVTEKTVSTRVGDDVRESVRGAL